MTFKFQFNNHKSEVTISVITLFILIMSILKLCGIVSCSWWLIFSPIWFPFIVMIGAIGVIIMGFAVLSWLE